MMTITDKSMFSLKDEVQITNHSEPDCNGRYGMITSTHQAYNGSIYYVVQLHDSGVLCECLEDELMEG